MKYRLLGSSGLRVSEVCLGTMTFGEDWGFGASKEESRKVFEAYSESGGNFIDTANAYTNGTSEKLVGELVAPDREHYVLATKYTLSTRPGDPNAMGNHRKNMVQSIEKSLKRMGTDYIDLYWVHIWDGTTSVDEVMRALDDLVRAGKVLYVGISDTPAWIVSQANTIADFRGWSRFVGLQIEYSLIERTPERDLLPMARALDIAVTAWGSLGFGLLSGKYAPSNATDAPIDSKRAGANQARLTERNLRIAAEVDAIAKEIDRSSSQVAVTWVRQQSGVVIPVVGVRTAAQMQDNIRSVEFELSQEHLDRLNKVSSIDLGFPHSFIASPDTQRFVTGGVSTVLNHRRRH
jgi:aryl-alcohol dehydrogenase-like predicted oxidoreductase